MFGTGLTYGFFWWMAPIFMMIFCFFMMRGKRGGMMCGFGRCGIDNPPSGGTETAREILDKRYAAGEINKDEYEEKKMTITDDGS